MLRRRNVSRRPSGDSVHSTEAIDEQQQEELVSGLVSENERSNAQHSFALQAIIGISIALQLFFLFQCSKHNRTWTPLSNLLPSANPQPRVPLSHFWTLLNILYHIHSAILLRPGYVPTRFLGAYTKHLEPLPIWPVTLIAPILCLLLRRDVPQSIWWLIPGCLTAAVAFTKQSIQQSREDILQLNELKYNLQGA